MTTKKQLIYREDLLAEYDRVHIGPPGGARKLMEDAPTVDAVEVVHGRWNMDKLEMGNPYDGNSTMLVDIGNCSVCGHRCEMLPIMNYCPNCGAKMDGGVNG